MAPSARKKIRNIIYCSPPSAQGNALREFFTMLAVCHTVVVEKDVLNMKKTKEEFGNLKYSASSPDELALVQGAKEVGIIYHKRVGNIISIGIGNGINPSTIEEFETIVEFPFDSTRKRMSLIVKQLGSGKYFLMTKGADSIMLPRIKIDIQT